MKSNYKPVVNKEVKEQLKQVEEIRAVLKELSGITEELTTYKKQLEEIKELKAMLEAEENATASEA